MNSPHFIKLIDGVIVDPLVASLESKPWLFDSKKERRCAPGSPHSGVEDIWVRYNDYDNVNKPNFHDEHESVWYEEAFHLPEVFPIVFGLMSMVRGERLGGVLITKTPPGGRIEDHIDTGWHAGYYEKYYVALKCAPGAIFRFGERDMLASTGDVWWFRNDVPHEVINGSDQDRLAMIVCIKHARGLV